MKSFQKNLIFSPVLQLLYDEATKARCGLLKNESDKTTAHVRYQWRWLAGAENKYDMMQQERLVIVWAVLSERTYRESTHHAERNPRPPRLFLALTELIGCLRKTRVIASTVIRFWFSCRSQRQCKPPGRQCIVEKTHRWRGEDRLIWRHTCT